jgi:hypothetical protein
VRLDRYTLGFVALAVALGNTISQFLYTVGASVGSSITDALDEDPYGGLQFTASFRIGDLKVTYGALVQSLLGLALVLAAAAIAWRLLSEHLASP